MILKLRTVTPHLKSKNPELPIDVYLFIQLLYDVLTTEVM